MKYLVRKKPSDIHTVEEARARAYKRLPRAVFDYLDGAAEGERTMRANLAAFDALQFRPRMAVTTVRPRIYARPSLVSCLAACTHRPYRVDSYDACGWRSRRRPRGGSAGTILTVSTMSGHRIAEVADAAMGPLWFQLYFLGGRKGAETLVDRARVAGYQALVVTLIRPRRGPASVSFAPGCAHPSRSTSARPRKWHGR